jgi:hypothetical protein
MRTPLPLLAVLLSGCTGSGHLVFFTNTSFGMEVSGDTATQTPRIVMGYKRQEGVLMPVYDERKRSEEKVENGNTIVKTEGQLCDEAFSVIAKYVGGGTAGGQSRMSNSQWFATGPAAINLSKAPGIAGAMADNPDVAEAAAKESQFLSSRELSSELKTATLFAAFLTLEKTDTPKAREMLARVTSFATKHKKQEFTQYLLDTDAKTFDGKKDIIIASNTWQVLETYRQNLNDSITALGKVLSDASYKEAGATPARPNEARLGELVKERDAQALRLQRFDDSVRKEPAIIEALIFLADLLKGRTNAQ